MVLTIRCPECGYSLRFADELAGHSVRCFNCENECTLPSRTEADPGSVEQTPRTAIADAWYLKTTQGDEYGPVPKSDLVEWMNEGRIDDSVQIRQEDGPWQRANIIFPALSSRSQAEDHRDHPVRDLEKGREHPDAPNGVGGKMSAADDYLPPHHGEVVLILAILGLFLCCCGLPLSLIAAVWGSIQLRGIQEGAINPSGRGMLQAGRILGVINCVLSGLVVVFFLFSWFI